MGPRNLSVTNWLWPCWPLHWVWEEGPLIFYLGPHTIKFIKLYQTTSNRASNQPAPGVTSVSGCHGNNAVWLGMGLQVLLGWPMREQASGWYWDTNIKKEPAFLVYGKVPNHCRNIAAAQKSRIYLHIPPPIFGWDTTVGTDCKLRSLEDPQHLQCEVSNKNKFGEKAGGLKAGCEGRQLRWRSHGSDGWVTISLPRKKTSSQLQKLK